MSSYSDGSSDCQGDSLSSITTPDKPYIEALPDEIFCMIAAACEAGDLSKLRLTNKTFCRISNKYFGEQCLASRRFIFTEHSLEGLIELTAHEIFGPCIRNLTFGTASLYSRSKHSRDSVDSYEHHYAKAQLDFLLADLHVKYLCRALRNLKKLGNMSVVLGIYDDILGEGDDYPDYTESLETYRPAYGSAASYGPYMPNHRDTAKSLRSIIRATELSSYPVTHLDFDVSMLEMGLILKDEKLRPLLVTEDHGLRLNPDIDLTFRAEHPHCILDDPEEIVYSGGLFYTPGVPTLRITNSATRLELGQTALTTEYTDTFPRLEEDFYGAIVYAIRNTTTFTDLIVRDTHLEADILDIAISGSKKSLRNIEFDQIVLFGYNDENMRDDWTSMFVYLKDELSLERLSLKLVVDYLHSFMIIGTKVVWLGREEIQRELSNLIRLMTDGLDEYELEDYLEAEDEDEDQDDEDEGEDDDEDEDEISGSERENGE